jgi:hypothetical protein
VPWKLLLSSFGEETEGYDGIEEEEEQVFEKKCISGVWRERK